MIREVALPLAVRFRLPLTRRLFALRLRLGRRPTLAMHRELRSMRQAVGGQLPVVHLFTVAFNNPTVIELQAQLLERHLVDPWRWTVADNSSDRRARRAIRDLCRSRRVSYLRLPRNPYTGRDPSRSHAEALNYVAHRCAGAVRAQVVGFLDHDVFPIRPTSVTARLGTAVAYGRFQERSGSRYLWPGLLFLRIAAVDLRSVDFHPRDGGDTGAGLAATVYRRLRPDEIVLMGEVSELFDGSDHERFDILDDWVHTVNASYWRPAGAKEERVSQLLDRLVQRSQG